MSHFAVLLIGDESQLDRFDENMEIEEYLDSAVSDYEKAALVEYYDKSLGGRNVLGREFMNYSGEDLRNEIVRNYNGCHDEKVTFEPITFTDSFILWACSIYSKEYGEWFKVFHEDKFVSFDSLYEEHGEDWNGSRWRKNDEGVWCEYSRYNPDSRWDWYQLGGRYRGNLKLKEGSKPLAPLYHGWQYGDDDEYDRLVSEGYCDKAYKKDIANWCDEDFLFFAVVINGEWHERGETGWWGKVSNEKEKELWKEEFDRLLEDVADDEVVSVIDCHT